LVAVKLLFIEQRSGAMQQACKDELNIIANPLPAESREQRSRRSPIKTPVVVENPNSQAFPLQCGQKLIGMPFLGGSVKQERPVSIGYCATAMPACFSATAPMNGSLNNSPWSAFTSSTTQKTRQPIPTVIMINKTIN